MSWTIVRTGEPASEPVTLAELKAHARIDHALEDSLLGLLIAAARERIEDVTRRALIAQEWTLTLDRFPCGPIFLPRPRLILGTASITYVDVDGESQSVSGFRELPGDAGARLVPGFGETWPSARAQPGAVVVTFDAGYGSSAGAVPAALRLAIVEEATTRYDQRQRGEADPGRPEAALAALCGAFIVPRYDPEE